MNDYELIESLGAAHPVEVSVTVAEAEQRERRGIPLPIGGDPESDHAKELLRIRRERQAKLAAKAAASTVKTEAAAGPDVVGRLRVEADLFLEALQGDRQFQCQVANEVSHGNICRCGLAELRNVLASSLDQVDHLLAELVSDRRSAHKTSPSVGAPNGAVCDNQKPTEGDLHQGGTSSKKAGHLL